MIEALNGWPPPVLDPAGPYAQSVTTLAWALFAMGVIVTLIVALFVGLALFGDERSKRKLGGERMIWIGGVAFPAVVLTGLLIWSLTLTRELNAAPTGEELRIEVTGEMWWWRVTYFEGGEAIADANEIHVPTGRPILISLTSNDVIHSFWAPRLAGKTDMIPGRTNTLRFVADEPGVYRGQCAEYCGGAHALMGFFVVAHDPDDFASLLQARAAPAAPPRTSETTRGAEVFASSGCGACHTVRGSAANGLAGPDLTHVGARRSIGAGILPNNQGTLAGWVSNSQAIKPGNRMPPYPGLSGADLIALSAYLDSLE